MSGTMNGLNCDTSSSAQATVPVVDPHQLSPVEALSKWVHGCGGDAATRTAAVTSLVFSFCQLAGHGLTHVMPSLVLIAPEEPDEQPVAMLARRLVSMNGKAPEKYRTGIFDQYTEEQAEKTMEWAVIELSNLSQDNPCYRNVRATLVKRFFEAQQAFIGTGDSRRYAKAWHKYFGLMTDRNNRLILRLETEQDAQEFRRDAIKPHSKLFAPVGYGSRMEQTAKHIAISGHLTPEQWDADLVQGALNLPFPVMFLPHSAETPLSLPEEWLLRAISDARPVSNADEPANFLPHAWFEHYAMQLRRHLRHLPGNYEHAFQRIGRQLFPACLCFANQLGRYHGTNIKETGALALDLAAFTLRGMVISMAGLAWHGYGFDGGCLRQEAKRVLTYIRGKGRMTASDFNRKAHINNKGLRDLLVEQFAEEGLVEIDGKWIRPTTYEEFVEALYGRKEFPPPENHWASLSSEEPAEA